MTKIFYTSLGGILGAYDSEIDTMFLHHNLKNKEHAELRKKVIAHEQGHAKINRETKGFVKTALRHAAHDYKDVFSRSRRYWCLLHNYYESELSDADKMCATYGLFTLPLGIIAFGFTILTSFSKMISRYC